MNAPFSSTAALRPAEVPPADIAAAGAVSGVSWGAILAGAAGAAALSLILLILGTGLGLSSVSPWVGQGSDATTIGVSTIAWLAFTQLAASGMGGYLAGRLRVKWSALHTDEVYFRDTAHGFLAWAVATLVTATVLTSTIGSVIGAGAKAGGAVAGGAVSSLATGAAALARPGDGGMPEGNSGTAYAVDALFRKDAMLGNTSAGSANNTGAAAMTDSASGAPADSPNTASNAEVARIFANDLRTGELPAEDARYVGQLVSQRTGLAQADAEMRVKDSFAKLQNRIKSAENAAREAADKARKASAGVALWLFVSLLLGAFVASLAATYGGRRRDL